MFGGLLGMMNQITPIRIADFRFEHLLNQFVPMFRGLCFSVLHLLSLGILERLLKSLERFGRYDVCRRLRLIVGWLLHFSLY
jgi:hypothetical protein